MALEIETKYLNADHAALRARLAELGAGRVGRWLERNAVYDDADRSLKARGTLLRLREKPGGAVLTLKRSAAATSATAKIYEEHETRVDDARALRGVLCGLGYAEALRYEKIREKWKLAGCEVCLDTLPFGDFVEIEGAEADILACAGLLGLQSENASTATYHELNRQHRQAANLPPRESFVFESEQLDALRPTLD